MAAPNTGSAAATTTGTKAEKSYLASAVDSINPWATNRSVVQAAQEPQQNTPKSTGADHTLNPYYGQSFKKYPSDCPPLKVQWFYAVDVPKRKPKFLSANAEKDDPNEPAVQPKKFTTFSPADSRALEAAYQKKLEETEAERAVGGSKRPRAVSADTAEPDQGNGVKVPVHEDFLFDVDIDKRELAPVYWEGPVYEVRRGTWFFQEGSNLRPCEENLASQLEAGYLKLKPWANFSNEGSTASTRTITPKSSIDNLKEDKTSSPNTTQQAQRWHLFGPYIESNVTYQDASVAYLNTGGAFAWMKSTVYERFAGGGHIGGEKLVRGYSASSKAKEEKRPLTPTAASSTESDEKLQKARKRRSAPPSTRSTGAQVIDNPNDAQPAEPERITSRLTRQLSNMLERNQDSEAEEEAIRKREEEEMLDDYNTQAGESQGREIEHLVLVTHGIGQLLGKRMESLNFVHDVNSLRKTIKSVYSNSADLRSYNSEVGEEGPGNCRVQVLPVVWRHLVDFPKRRRSGEQDIGNGLNEEDKYPSLEDITMSNGGIIQQVFSELALDVLMYQSGYRQQITEIVMRESNRIFRQFKQRNPQFQGKLHIIGHSLGSAIMFDILCRQKEKPTQPARNPLRIWPSQERSDSKDQSKDLEFDFDVEDFYCLGSPVGLFQMLKKRTIAARSGPGTAPSMSPMDPDSVLDPFGSMTWPPGYTDQRISPITGHPLTVSSPKVGQLFNIFHPEDPIAYRLEPLVSSALTALQPQKLPATRKFGLGLPDAITGIGQKFGQSVTGLFSNFSAGLANNWLSWKFGLPPEATQPNPSPGAGTNIAGGVVSDDALREQTAERQRQLAAGQDSGNAQTLIDDDMETLYSNFLKERLERAKTLAKEGTTATTPIDVEAMAAREEKALKLKMEEQKVRALNRNGRIDYCLQVGNFEFGLWNTFVSHISYWSDEDVSHFVLSQMLAKKKKKQT